MTDEQILDNILAHEGGFVNHPDDRGKATNFGITQATLSEWLGRPATIDDIRRLDVGSARAIYRTRYLQPFAHITDGVLKAQVVDIAVNSGVARARALLIRAQAQTGRPLSVQLVVERLKHYAAIVKGNPSQAVFISGWVNRAVSFLVLVLLCTVPVFAVDWATVVKPAAKQVPRLQTVNAAGEKGICAAVVINAAAGFALTCAHCVAGKSDELSITVNGRHAEVARSNRLIDLAVVRFTAKDEQTMPLALVTPPAGAPIAVLGFMLGAKDLHTQFGHIASRRSEDGAIVVDGVILPGDSGGALVNERGELIGISNQYYRGTAIGLAIPIEVVRDFVEPYLPVVRK